MIQRPGFAAVKAPPRVGQGEDGAARGRAAGPVGCGWRGRKPAAIFRRHAVRGAASGPGRGRARACCGPNDREGAILGPIRTGAALLLTAVVARGAAPAPVQFVDAAAPAGVHFVHANGATDQKRLPEAYGSGVAFADLDGDGALDLYFVNSGHLVGGRGDDVNRAYRNAGDGTFADMTDAAGAPGVGYGMGVLAGDYDGDGDADLHLTEVGPDRLYRNDGGGRFEERAEREGLGGRSWGTSAAYLDYDLDGDLDLFVADYVEYSPGANPWCGRRDLDLRFYCDPRGYEPTPDRLYRNEGQVRAGPRFTDVSADAGITARGNGLGVVAGDFDGDGDPDVYVANDMMPNFLYENRGQGLFVEGGLLAGVALSGDGAAQAGMGVDAGDFDGDGDPDLLVTNYQLESNALYRNDGSYWTDVSFAAGIGEVSLNYLGFGTGFFDYDNDGHPDIFVANGHVHDNIERYDPIVTHAQRTQVLRNLGATFADVTDRLGPGLAPRRVGRGSAFGDYDGDGDVDVAVNCGGGPAALLRNDGSDRSAWLGVALEGRGANRAGVGARVRVTAAGATRTAWVRAGSGYLSTSDPALHFGLGAADSARRVEVTWPSGSTQVLTDVPGRQVLRILEADAAKR